MTYSIKEPEWGPAGCVGSRSINTPQGWLALRKDTSCWVVTGVDKTGWKNFKSFKTEEEAEKFALDMYYEQVKRWLE
jgi:hypothetical protein